MIIPNDRFLFEASSSEWLMCPAICAVVLKENSLAAHGCMMTWCIRQYLSLSIYAVHIPHVHIASCINKPSWQSKQANFILCVFHPPPHTSPFATSTVASNPPGVHVNTHRSKSTKKGTKLKTTFRTAVMQNHSLNTPDLQCQNALSNISLTISPAAKILQPSPARLASLPPSR